MPTKKWALENPEKMKEARRKWYANNKIKGRATKKARKESIKQWYKSYKKNLSCSCGENHWACLEFHHTNPEEKEFTIAYMINRGFSIENILKEIEKCLVVCSNCHRKIHYGELPP